MNFHLPHPYWLLAAPMVVGWILWLSRTSYVDLGPCRRWCSLILRLLIGLLFVLALAGLQWLKPMEGVNVFFLLDRSDSIPQTQQDSSLKYVSQVAKAKKDGDKAGLIVFGTEASIESTANPLFNPAKIHAVVPTERTDIGAAVRLAAAAFPEHGQKRIVILSDGNENRGDALGGVLASKPLGVSVDIVPLGAVRGGDVAISRVSIPSRLKKGQTFEMKILATSDQACRGALRVFRNDQLLGEQQIQLNPGKNLFALPQSLTESGFYYYDVQLDTPDDPVPQNNRASGFAFVRGNPRLLLISSDPSADIPLRDALQSSGCEVKAGDLTALPRNLVEMESYDSIFLSNIAAGDLSREIMLLLESAVRDFGVGMVCIGGDQSFTAGGYRGTPLESLLPVDMELSSKKVLPSGALVLVVHATEFPNGNQWARDIAFAALDALGPQDEMGIVLWDGKDRWLFPLTKVGDKKALGRQIAGMTPGDMPSFQKVMEMAYNGLKKSTANLKHMVVFSDGDPTRPSNDLVNSITGSRITISSVMIGGHVAPDTMLWLADQGHGRFYDVNSPGQLPQIFIKEAAVILKSAIYEDPFKPRMSAVTEPIRGISSDTLPSLKGYVAVNPKPRAEVPLLTDKGDPLLAHWQYGLGRVVAFTSDARGKWAVDWLHWNQYRQFWVQTAQWSIKRLENSEFSTDVGIEKGEGHLNVEVIDSQGNYRNFLSLQATILSPKGERNQVSLEQTGPGHYEARFQTRDVGAYLVNLTEMEKGKVVSSQVIGTSVNYSPEYEDLGPNENTLNRLMEAGSGKMLNPSDLQLNPFLHDRQKTFQPFDLWEWLLKLAIVLFPLDVGIRRIQLDRSEWIQATMTLRRYLLFWQKTPAPVASEASLAALLARKHRVQTTTTAVITPSSERLYTPVESSTVILPGMGSAATPTPPKPETSLETPGNNETQHVKTEADVTDRLLAAKRRAQRRKP